MKKIIRVMKKSGNVESEWIGQFGNGLRLKIKVEQYTKNKQFHYDRMKKFILLVLLLLISAGQSLMMKRVVLLPSGADLPSTYVVCADTDNDSLNELIFSTMAYTYVTVWKIYEHQTMNHYNLVYADTGAYPYPPGIETENFFPNDVGDIDQDSLIDLVGQNRECANDSIYTVVTTQESPSRLSYPEILSWYYRCSFGDNASFSSFTDDLDGDNKKEIMKAVPSLEMGHTIWENVGNNQNQVVWNCTCRIADGFNYAYGDFDLDNRSEFITAQLGSFGKVTVFENTGDDQYEMTFQDTVLIPNGSDVFSGDDLDGDGKPEFFIGFAQWVSGNIWDFYLYMWETTGNNTYERTHIATIRAVDWLEKRSKCGDIDGDGIEELVWSIGAQIIVYKATGNNQFERIWTWYYDHGGDYPHSLVNIYDMNRNGYNEIVVSGNNKTSIFEVEAVWLRRPNGGENFIGNTQEQIRWQKFYPPRCDSLSLYYSLDNGRTYDTIISGLSGIDSSYIWTVPDNSSDSCKVKIIAYGPGWQYDESDGVFTITPSGIDEIASPSLAMTSIEILPNPAKGKIRFKIWNANQDLTLKIYNLAGELVKDFSERFFASLRMTKGVSEFIWDGTDDKGKKLPTGVYVYRLKTTDGISETKEFIILR